MGWEKSYYRCASVSPVEISEERREKSHNTLGGVGVRSYNLKNDSNISAEGTSSKCKELMNKYEPLHPAITFYVFPIVEEETVGDILKSFPKRSPKQCKQRCWIWELGPRINSVEQMDVSQQGCMCCSSFDDVSFSMCCGLLTRSMCVQWKRCFPPLSP